MWNKGFIASLLLFSCSANEHERRWIQELVAKKDNTRAGMHTKQWAQDTLTQSHQMNEIQQHQSDHVRHGAQQEAHDVHSHRLSTLADRICWEDGISCEVDTTCINCCNGTSTSVFMGTVCGSDSCLEDGTVCYDEENNGDWNCYQCCNMPYGGNTCGGECNEAGTLCDIDSTCMSCCNYTYYSIGDGEYQCGCKADGESCIPGSDCYSCCNGAYNDDGATCGGTCIPDTTACTIGVDCHLCCTWYSFWYSTGQTQCGYESCFPDGEKCIPGVSCSMCCSGGAYDGDGTVCGGECTPSGSECNYLSSCNKCCQEDPYGNYMLPSPITNSSAVSLSPSITPTSTSTGSYYDMSTVTFGTTSYWNYTSSSMVCGNEKCWANGTSCMPGSSCYKCCYGANANGGTECGGECLPSGSKCNYYSTCNSCCDYNSMFDEDLNSYVCKSYSDMYNSSSGYPPF